MIELMENGDIIKGPGPRAPRYLIIKQTKNTYIVRDQCNQVIRFRKNLPWYKVN